jgi:formylglycine-generating enzyme required for sulfatase activity
MKTTPFSPAMITFFCCIGFFQPSAFAADSIAIQKCMASKLTGTVRIGIVDKQKWTSVREGMQCGRNQTILTAPNSRLAMTFEPAMNAALEENTLLTFENMTINHSKKHIRMLLKLQKGIFTMAMEPLFGYTALLTIETPSAAIDLNGAQLTLQVSGDTTIFDLVSGGAKIHKIAEKMKSVVEAGTRVIIISNKSEISFLPLLPAQAKLPESAGPARKQPKIAILSVQSSTVTKENLERVSDYIAEQFEKKSSGKVLFLEDIRSMLASEGMDQLLGCFADSCISRIGNAIGADIVIIAGIGQLGSTHLFSLKMIDALRDNVISRTSLKINGDAGKILDEIPTAVDIILKKSERAVDSIITMPAPPQPSNPGESKPFSVPKILSQANSPAIPVKTAHEATDETPPPESGGPAKPYRETITWIKGASFVMGSKPIDGAIDETPQHHVTIQGFFMDKYEVTKNDYERVMGVNPTGSKGCGACPVENVSWDEAQDYCKKLGKRLPTEAEWEYACRAGTTTEFSFGNALSGDQANFNAAQPFGGAPSTPSRNKTVPVGSYPANAWGLYDMHGNVAEWCLDWYDALFYGNSPKENPQGPKDGKLRVARGGGWNSNGSGLRSSRRTGYNPTLRLNSVGFRCVKEDSDSPAPGQRGK